MKHLLLSITLVLFTFGSFASNKICVGEKVIVVFNESLKKLTVHDRETLEVLQSTELEGYNFGEIALSQNGSKIWFQMDGKMYCRDVETGEILKELQGVNRYKFELSAAQDYLIHYERIEQSSLIYVYDLNTAQAISYAKVDFSLFLETIHYDHAKQTLYLLSRTFPSKTEKPSKEPLFGLPETAEQIELDFRHDQEESRYYVYDIANKKVMYDEVITYSPDFACDFEVINDRLFLITQIGTAEVLDDYSLKITSLVILNMSDYAILESEMVGPTGFFLFSHSFKNGAYKELDDSKANKILVEADGIAMTETDYYAINEGIFYRFKRSEPLNVDFEIALD
ncbi:MAG: hypothetical protein HRT58_02415 [Crocinitomicaceae bacterium]|nr:hypothetical protein [Flavobacteriales bacterium]NQZ34482.1 hypothetical protein [Crocinitomicaceae bacterium]